MVLRHCALGGPYHWMLKNRPVFCYESPYPGKTSKTVADLLQAGYRMPRPAHVSQELYSIMRECWEEAPSKRPTFQWLCSAMKRLLDDIKTYVNLEIYDCKNYVNFDMIMDKE